MEFVILLPWLFSRAFIIIERTVIPEHLFWSKESFLINFVFVHLQFHYPPISSIFLHFVLSFRHGGGGGTLFNMDKLPEFNSEEDIEEWIEVFECRAACSKVKDDEAKFQGCRSVIECVSHRIIKRLPDGAQWGQVKAELRKYLGEDNPISAAWKGLMGDKTEGKCFGEITSEVKELAEKASDEEDR